MSQRLSRKEIKRDEFAEAMERFADWARLNARTLGLVAAGVAVLVLAVVGVFLYLNHREQVASEALDRAMIIYSAPLDAADPQPDDPDEPSFADEAARRGAAQAAFEEVEGRYGGTDAGGTALAYLGRIALDQGDEESARAHWQALLDRDADNALAAEIQLNLINLDRAAGKFEELASELEAMLERTEQALPEDVILFQLAEVREELGRGAEALSAYQRIVDDYPDSPFTGQAGAKARELAESVPAELPAAQAAPPIGP